MTPAPVGCETGFAKRPGRRDPGSMSRPRRGARRDAWRGRRDQLAAVEQRLRGLRPPTQHLRRPPCPARPGKPAVPARAASGKDLECHRADGTDRRTAAAARQRARSHCSNASGSGSVTMPACSSPLLISSPIQRARCLVSAGAHPMPQGHRAAPGKSAPGRCVGQIAARAIATEVGASSLTDPAELSRSPSRPPGTRI